MKKLRPPHILNPSKRKTYPERVIFFDTEADTDVTITDEEIQRARENQTLKLSGQEVRKDHIIYAISATRYRDVQNARHRKDIKDYIPSPEEVGSENYFRFVREFWRDVDKFTAKGKTTYMFAHNAKYDMQVSQGVSILAELGYRISRFNDANPAIFEFQKPHPYTDENGETKVSYQTILILSSTNYFQQSLAKLGEAFGLEKLDFDHDQKVDMTDSKFVKEMMIYLHRDVEILETAMLSFLDFIIRENLGKFCLTLASQTFTAYKHRFLQHEIFIHNDERALAVERAAYAGGRNEVFTMGEVTNRTYYLDINSMYPHVMLSERFPTKLKTFWVRREIEEVMNAIKAGYLICAECYVDVDVPIYHKKDKRLVFPVGKFWTALSTPEIKIGIERGYIKMIKNICVYEGSDIFSGFIDFFYNARLDAKHRGDDVHNLLYKLFMNALYGKFGQKDVDWNIATDDEGVPLEFDYDHVEQDSYFDYDAMEMVDYKIFGGRMLIKDQEAKHRESFDSFPAIAAHVTAYARMLLWSFIESAGIEHVHYCDTDSVFVDYWGYITLWLDNRIDEDRLGALKIEKIGERVEFRGCKDYLFDDGKKVNDKIKGISKSKSTRYIGKDDNGKDMYAVMKWNGFAKRFKEGNFTEYFNEVTIKTLRRDYMKGIVKGNRVEPFQLFEPLEVKRENDKPKPNRKEDEISHLIHFYQYGYIKVPLKGEPGYSVYSNLTRTEKGKYFRMNKGLPFLEWLDVAGLSEKNFVYLLSK